jgi:tetratricopeptide (TPR) repeat protein
MRICPSLVLIMVCALAGPAFAINQRDRDDCAQADDVDLRIAGCTRVIHDGTEPDRMRVLAHGARGEAYQAKGDIEAAIIDYGAAISLDPDNAEVYRHRGIAYRILGDYDRAIADFSQAIRIDPQDAGAFLNRGGAYHAKGDNGRASADYDQAQKLNAALVAKKNEQK